MRNEQEWHLSRGIRVANPVSHRRRENLAFADPDALWQLIIATANEHVPLLPVSSATQPPVVLGTLPIVPL